MTRNETVEKYTQMILDAERFIWKHPEIGYKEFETTAYTEHPESNPETGAVR